jgi:hypothetical protein
LLKVEVGLVELVPRLEELIQLDVRVGAHGAIIPQRVSRPLWKEPLADLHGRRNDIYAARREGDHDDLVLAVAVACWYATRGNVTLS